MMYEVAEQMPANTEATIRTKPKRRPNTWCLSRVGSARADPAHQRSPAGFRFFLVFREGSGQFLQTAVQSALRVSNNFVAVGRVERLSES